MLEMGGSLLLDLVIRNGMILDGTGNPWYRSDIGISGDEIVKISRHIEEKVSKTIDGAGLYVSPGFIDMHTHWDLRVFAHPEEEEKLRQGITTSLIGQDGLSVAPLRDEVKEEMRLRVSGLLGKYIDSWPWNSMEEYLGYLAKAGPSTNYMMLVPHGAIRVDVLGWDNRPASDNELDRMKCLLGEALDEGACGFSTGLIYPPGMYADRRELVELCRVTGDKGGFFVVHMRDEGNFLMDSIREVSEICIEAACPLHISHLKVAGRINWGKSGEVLELLEAMRDRGLELTFDQYPYTAGSTMLDALIPPRFHTGGTEKLLERLSDPAIREEIRMIVESEKVERWENWVAHCGWDGILINSVGSDINRFAEGKTLDEIGKITDQTPFEALCHLLVSEEGQVVMTQFYGDEKDVENFMNSDYMTLCSDAIVGGKPHPRAFGSTCRFLGEYVRERGVLTLPQAVLRMTSRSARRLGLSDRGLLREGMKADITVFDYGKINEKGTFREPNQYPQGIVHVIINGQPALYNGELTGSRRGRVLRTGQDAGNCCLKNPGIQGTDQQ